MISHLTFDKTLFEFDVNKDEFDIPELADSVHVSTYGYQTGSNYTFSGKIISKFTLNCDRCLENYNLKLDIDFEVIYTSEDQVEKDDNLMYFSPQDIEIDLKPYVRDSILLNIPFKKLCSEKCKGLCAKCGANFNHEQCNCNTEKTDPRWDSLKELKTTLENAEE